MKRYTQTIRNKSTEFQVDELNYNYIYNTNNNNDFEYELNSDNRELSNNSNLTVVNTNNNINISDSYNFPSRHQMYTFVDSEFDISENNSINETIDADSDDDLIKSNSRFSKPQDIRKDLKNILFLMFLYLLQGIPLGLTGSLPFILSSRNVSYADQGTFSFAVWPYSLKLLWAPFVDSLFIKKFGRRKSWICPIMYIMGIFMICFSKYVYMLLDGDRSGSDIHSDIFILTAIFFSLTFLTATQDIAVDGWGLTILSKENTSWSSTCNNTGATAGWFIGNVIFLVLESADFCNKYIRPIFGLTTQTYGMVTIDKFMQFFGIVFLVSTTFILLFKKEETNDNIETIEDKLTLTETYKLVWDIFTLSSVRKYAFLLLTCRIAYGVHSMTYLKLIEKGVPKEKLGLLAIPITPIEIVLPLLVSRYSNGPRPLDFYVKSYPWRILTTSIIVLWVFVTPFFKDEENNYPFYYYLLCILVSGLNSCFVSAQSVTVIAFNTRVSDKTVGGTYMTLLNTIGNIGNHWPQTLYLYLVDILTKKSCNYDWAKLRTTQEGSTPISLRKLFLKLENNNCVSSVDIKECLDIGGTCATYIDGYYILHIVSAIIGILWITSFRKTLFKLQSISKSAWKIDLQKK